MSEHKRLQRDFYTRDGITLARELLGKILVHETDQGMIRGIITETESYMGEQDKGSHTYGGKRTQRTEPMYHIGGDFLCLSDLWYVLLYEYYCHDRWHSTSGFASQGGACR